jgi:hypothetical protein
VSLNGDYLVAFRFDKLTGDTSVEGGAPALAIPDLVFNQIFPAGSNFFANIGTDSSSAGAGYRLESSQDMVTWEPRHLFTGNGSPLSSNSSYGGGRFFRLVANRVELEQLALGELERDEDAQ